MLCLRDVWEKEFPYTSQMKCRQVDAAADIETYILASLSKFVGFLQPVMLTTLAEA